MAGLSETEHLASGAVRAGVSFGGKTRAKRMGYLGGVLLLAAVAMVSVTMHKWSAVVLVSTGAADSVSEGARVKDADAVESAKLDSPARFQDLSWADELQLQPGYLPPKDLFVFWGKSSFKGHGPLGRASSAERVRQVLNLGHFTGNSYVDYQHGYGHFLYDWEGAQFRKMARSCCATVLVPPMEADLPLYWDSDKAARNIRNFVSNGNRLILTGGSYSSLVFLNRYFHFNLRKQVYDAGPFDKQPLPQRSLLKEAARGMPNELPQSGLAVTSVELDSLPKHTDVLYASDSSSPMFEITFCEKVQEGLRGYWCSFHAGQACQEDAHPGECRKLHDEGKPCTCGSILYDGFDFVDNHKTWIGASVWDDTIRDAAKFPMEGTPGQAVWPAPSPPPPPPPPPSVWTAHVFWNYYDLVSMPDLQYLPLVGQGQVDGFIRFNKKNPLAQYVGGELPDRNVAGAIYGTMFVEIPGYYTLCVRSRDGSRLWIGDRKVVDNDGVHRMFRSCAVQELGEGFHEVVLDFFTREGDPRLKVTYSGPDTDDNERRLNSWNADAPPAPPGSDWDMRMFSTDLHTLSVVERTSGLDFVGETTVPYLSFGGMADFQEAMPDMPTVNFIYQFFGRWDVDVGGDYKLCTECDEGSRLFMDGRLLLDNSAYDGSAETCIDITLEKGSYDIKADGFQSGGDVYLRVSYEGPATRGNRQLMFSGEPNAPPVPEPSRFTMRVYQSPFELRDIPSMYNLNFVGETEDLPVIDLENHDAFRKYVPETPDASFAWEIYGSVFIQTGGYYEFCQTSDDGSITYIDSNVAVSDPGLHGARQVCNSVFLTAGAHPLKLVGFDWGGAVFVKLEYSGPDTYDVRVLVVSDSNEAPERSEGSSWAFQCFCGGEMATVPDMSALSPCGETTVDYVNFPSMEEMNEAISTCPLEHVGWRFDGQIVVSLEGTYYFCSTSDDGSFVYVDGNLVTNNDGLHGAVERCGGVYLYPGPHSVRVDGFNNGGPGSQLLTYQGPDTSNQKLFPYSVNDAIPAGP